MACSTTARPPLQQVAQHMHLDVWCTEEGGGKGVKAACSMVAKLHRRWSICTAGGPCAASPGYGEGERGSVRQVTAPDPKRPTPPNLTVTKLHNFPPWSNPNPKSSPPLPISP